MIKKLAIVAQDLLFSRFCYLCGQPRIHAFAFCRPCLRALPQINKHCPKCGLPLMTQQMCGQCLQTKGAINQTFPLFIYQNKIKECIIQLKYYESLYLVDALMRLMQHRLKSCYQNQAWPQAIISVPLHPHKMRVRGYNQTLALSKNLSKKLHIQDLSHQIIKTKKTKDQSSLALKQRKDNIKKAFEVRGKLPKHIAIIDDVVTTSETVKQLASVLKKHKVKTIDVWCLARTPLSVIL